MKQTRCTNFSNLFLEKKNLRVSESSSVHHQEFFTVHTVMVYVILEFHKRVKFQYDTYHCCVYSGKLLVIDRGTVRNM